MTLSMENLSQEVRKVELGSETTSQTDDETQLDRESATSSMTDEEIQVELSVALSQYLQNPESDKAPLKIVTVGRGSVGKSTLINNFFNLPEEKAAVARRSQRPVTKGVTVYKNTIHGAPVHIYDTPGMQDSRIDEVTVIKELRQQTEGSIDLLFYVASLNNRLEKSDENIIKLLTNEFKPKVWEHAIMVLSFANQFCRQPIYIKYTNECTEVFQEYVCKQAGCEDMVVKCIRSMDEHDGEQDSIIIPAVPTGQFENDIPKNWKSHLLIEVFRKSGNKNFIPLLLSTSRIQCIDQTQVTNEDQASDQDSSHPECRRHTASNSSPQHNQAGGKEENSAQISIQCASDHEGSDEAQDQRIGDAHVATGDIAAAISGAAGGPAGDAAGIAGTTTAGSDLAGDVVVGGIAVAVGSTAGGVAVSIAGTTTTVSTTFMGITIGVKAAAMLNSAAGLIGATATKTVVTTTAAATGAVGIGVVGGAVLAVGVGLGFKKYVWPIIKEKLNDDKEIEKKNQ